MHNQVGTVLGDSLVPGCALGVEVEEKEDPVNYLAFLELVTHRLQGYVVK